MYKRKHRILRSHIIQLKKYFDTNIDICVKVETSYCIAHYYYYYHHLRCKYRFIWIIYTKKGEVRRANSENEESIFVYVSAYTVHSDSARDHSLLELEKFDCSIRTIERPAQRVDIGRRLFN